MRAALILLLAPSCAFAQSLETLHRSASATFDGAGANAGTAAKFVPQTQSRGPMSLSDLARALAQDPTAADDLIDLLVAKAGPLGQALDTPEKRAELKRALRSADPAVLDRFPTLSLARLAEAGEAYASRQGAAVEPARPAELVLVLPGAPADPPRDAFLKPLGHGLWYGDQTLFGAGAAWGDSKALAEALNQLSARARLKDGARSFDSVAGWLTALLSEGHTLEIRDRRMYANFGDLRFESAGERRDVATPTLVDVGLVLPSGRRLIVPVPHSELHISLRGPRARAELSWFFGLDGRAAFRAKESADQSWVGGRDVRSWSGAPAAALLERAGWVSRELDAKAKAAGLAAGGYGPLGDCNDAHGLVTGSAPLGMLRDPARFAGSGALDLASQALPYDRAQPIDPRRVWDSRPFERAQDIPLPEARAAMLELEAALGAR